MNTLTRAAVAVVAVFALLLVAAIWIVFSPVIALAVGLALSIAALVWARGVEQEERLLTRPQAPHTRAFVDPEEV